MRYIARFNPLQDIISLQDAFERAFDIRWRHPTASEGKNPRFRLPLDVFEQEETYTVVASLPGVSVEDIDINLEDDILSIQANLPEFAAGEGAQTLWRERLHGQFHRQIRLPAPIQLEAVTAEYGDGLLRLTLPKAESARAQQIPVRSLQSPN